MPQKGHGILYHFQRSLSDWDVYVICEQKNLHTDLAEDEIQVALNMSTVFFSKATR
jgi:hypothetical protein